MAPSLLQKSKEEGPFLVRAAPASQSRRPSHPSNVGGFAPWRSPPGTRLTQGQIPWSLRVDTAVPLGTMGPWSSGSIQTKPAPSRVASCSQPNTVPLTTCHGLHAKSHFPPHIPALWGRHVSFSTAMPPQIPFRKSPLLTWVVLTGPTMKPHATQARPPWRTRYGWQTPFPGRCRQEHGWPDARLPL